MNKVKQAEALLAGSRKHLFNGVLGCRELYVLVVLAGMSGVAFQRTTGFETDDTLTPGATPTPSETVVTESPSPSPSPTAPVAEATPAATAVLSPTQIDPNLVGNWELSDSQVKPSENVRWEIRPNGIYRLLAGSETKTGILSTTTDGKIRLNVEFTGVVEIDYKIENNILTTTGPDGTAIDWRFMKSEPKPHKVVHRHHAPTPHHLVRDWFDKVKRFFGFSG
jgi:hypothetical protein